MSPALTHSFRDMITTTVKPKTLRFTALMSDLKSFLPNLREDASLSRLPGVPTRVCWISVQQSLGPRVKISVELPINRSVQLPSKWSPSRHNYHLSRRDYLGHLESLRANQSTLSPTAYPHLYHETASPRAPLCNQPANLSTYPPTPHQASS